MKFELFSRFGVLPGAGDRHLAEFFPGFLTEESGWGERWGVNLTTIEEREYWQDRYVAELDEMLASDEVSTMPSGEMVAPVITCLMLDQPGWFPLNIPNAGQVADLPDGVTVESMCVADGKGVHGRDEVHLPVTLAECVRRVSAAQELTVEAAVTGSRDKVFEAMLLDPLAGRIDFDRLRTMTDEMLDGDEGLAAAVRRVVMPPDTVVDALHVRVLPDGRALGAAAAAHAAAVLRDAIAARGVAHVMFASGNSQLAFLDAARRRGRRRLDAGRRVPHGRVRRDRRRPPGQLPPLHPRAHRRRASRSGRSTTSRATRPTPRRNARATRALLARPSPRPLLPRASARTATSRSTTRPSPTSTTRST